MSRNGELFGDTEPIDMSAVLEDERLIAAIQQRRSVSGSDARLTAMLAAWRDELLDTEDPAVVIWRAAIHKAYWSPMANLLGREH
jgi:Anti-sigma-D factor RsdA to sigma factor binding region